MENRSGWRLCAVASALALLGVLASVQAYALGLGRISVQSALGEPLRAEIDIADINADEASSLKATVASAEVFRAAGMEYSAAVSELQISFQKRADGRPYFRLSSPRPVTEPFVDLILEANWASGRIVRDYTMLFDPPNLRQSGSAASAAAVTAPILSRQAATAAPPATAITTKPYYPTTPPPAQAAVRPAPVAKAQPATVTPPAPRPATGGRQKLAVRPGDTAGKIAAQVKPASVSLDQMLVALLRSNPDAFIGGNINRLKSGSVLDIPDANMAAVVSAPDASATIVAQSRDFNDFRRKLAERVPATQVGSANRQAGGKVQAKVEDKAPVAATPDKLTLSKGTAQGKAAAEEKIVKDIQAKEASSRATELAKNIGDLNKLNAVLPGAGNIATAASAGSRPGIALTTPAALAAASSVAASSTVKPASSSPAAVAASAGPASAPAAMIAPATSTNTSAVPAASAPAEVASAPRTPASQAVVATATSTASAAVAGQKLAVAAPPSPPPPESSLMDGLTENPFLLPGIVGLLLLLGGFAWYRRRQRQNASLVDSSFLESRLQPDSFFGASGGQRIDTKEGGVTGSSLVYSPSQLDVTGDVDPVAEADVYLAYGRDLQAEEILKEALRTTPNRVAIHAKLMEIYAKRRNAKAFEVIALQAFSLTHGEGPEWTHIGEMGRELDPGNVLYRPGNQAAATVMKDAAAGPDRTEAFSIDTIPLMVPPEHKPASTPVDFDLDLDFLIGDEPAVVAPAKPVQPPEPAAPIKSMPVLSFEGLDMDFGADTAAVKPILSTPSKPAPRFDEKASDEALLASGLTFTNEPFTPATSAGIPDAAVMDHGMLEFDMDSLSLDLDAPITESPVAVVESAAATAESPLDTKFALAEEFRALGDMEGARALAEEVLAQANGSLKSKAQAFLNALS